MCGFKKTEPGFGDGVARTGGVAVRGGVALAAWAVNKSPWSRGGAGSGLSAGAGLRDGGGASELWKTGSSGSPGRLSFLRIPEIKSPRLVLLEWPWE